MEFVILLYLQISQIYENLSNKTQKDKISLSWNKWISEYCLEVTETWDWKADYADFCAFRMYAQEYINFPKTTQEVHS